MSNDIYSLNERVQSLTSENRLQTAMDEIFAFLDLNPNDEKANYLAGLVIFLSQDPDRTYNAAEPLTEEYLGDPRLDKLFCECAGCHSTWMPNPMMQALNVSAVIRFSPPGGVCPNCHKVFCRECARSIKSPTDASPQVCPQCSIPLSPIKKPTGRTTRQMPRRKQKLKLILVFREGPIPPDSEYLDKLLRQLSPDFLVHKPNIKAFPVFPWSEGSSIIMKKIEEVFSSQAIASDTHIIDNHQFYLENEDAHVYIVKIYDNMEGRMNTLRRDIPDVIMVFLDKEPSVGKYAFIKKLLADFQLDVDPVDTTVRITDSYADSTYVVRAAMMAATMRGGELDGERSTMEQFTLYDVKGTLASINLK